MAFRRSEPIRIGVWMSKILSHRLVQKNGAAHYHDTQKHKPDPAPIIKAIQNLDIKKEKAISIGDEGKDIIAAKKAGIKSIAALWGVRDKEVLLKLNPDAAFDSVSNLRDYLLNNLE